MALYARVSSADQKQDVERQLERLQSYATSVTCLLVNKQVTEVASGLNDSRPKLTALLKDAAIGAIVVEHKDRLTRFGFNYIVTLLEMQNRRVEVIFPDETRDDQIADFIVVITSMSARLYGRRGNKHRAERIRQCIEQAAHDEKSIQERA